MGKLLASSYELDLNAGSSTELNFGDRESFYYIAADMAAVTRLCAKTPSAVELG
jgi:hypothetical protein